MAGPVAGNYGQPLLERQALDEHAARVGIQDDSELRVRARSGLTRGAHRTRSGFDCSPHRYVELVPAEMAHASPSDELSAQLGSQLASLRWAMAPSPARLVFIAKVRGDV